MLRSSSFFTRAASIVVASSLGVVACSSSDGPASRAGSGGSAGSSGGGAASGAGAPGSGGGAGAGAGGRVAAGGGLAAGGQAVGAAGAGGSGNGGSQGAGGASDAGGGAVNLVAELLARTKACASVVSSHQYALDDGSMVDICAMKGAVYWTADMDIDCDGVQTAQCNATTDCCYQNDTAFHSAADQPLTASTTPYVVIPNDFSYAGLDTQNGGNVTAVLFQGKLQWAVFGDTGPTDIIGEASYACAQKLGIDPDPKTGGTGSGVTYVTFVGPGTAPADIEDQAGTAALGERLARQLIQNN